jgi:cytoskeletal protein CcmA (bactofilin family)
MKKFTYIATLIFLLVIMLGGAQLDSAQVHAAGESSAINGAKIDSAISISSNKNVYLSGSNIRPTANIDGDLMAMGGKIAVEHPVQGDAALFAGSVNVKASVGDDLRVVGGDVVIDGLVGGELLAAGGTITITKSARIAQGANLFGGEINIDGVFDGPLKVRAKKIVLNGEINNDANFSGEDIELGPMAKITGTFNYMSKNPLNRAQGAVVSGLIKHDEGVPFVSENNRENSWRGHSFPVRGSTQMRAVFLFVAMFACATLFQLLFPNFAKNATDRISTSPWQAIAGGMGAFFGVPALIVLLFITLLGIPLAILLLGLFPVLFLAGYIIGIFLIAQRVQMAAQKKISASFASNMGFFALALLLIMLLGYLPYFGKLIVFFITIIGTGACLLEVFRRTHQQPAAPV